MRMLIALALLAAAFLFFAAPALVPGCARPGMEIAFPCMATGPG